MGLQFWFGASGSGKSRGLYDGIIVQAKENPKKNFLVIVPDQFSMQTQMDLVSLSEGRGIFNIDVLSFGRLSHRIFDEVGGGDLPVLDDTGKSLVLRKVAADVAEQLPTLGKNLGRIGYINEVKSAISEFMQYGVSVEQLRQVASDSGRRGALKAKLQDLSVLYERFQAYVQEKYMTTEETLGRLCRVLPKSAIVRGSVVCFDGFTGFTPIQNRVIATLTELAERVIVTLDMDERENPYTVAGEQKLFYLSSKTVVSLERLIKERELPREKDVLLSRRDGCVARFRDNEELAHLERNLFRFPAQVYEGEPERLCLYEAATPREEVRQTCLKIWKLVYEQGYEYRQIAVVTGSMETYTQEIQELFERFGFPVFLDQTRGLLLNPFIELIRAALQLLQKNFSYETVLHYLRSGLTGFTPEEVDAFENYVLAFGIRGKKMYENMFVRRKHGDEEALQRLELVNKIRERLMEQVRELLAEGKTAGDYARALYRFLDANQIQKKLVAYENLFLKKDEFARAKEYGQIYRLVMDLLDQIVGLLGEEPMSFAEFYEILDAGFGEIEVGAIPQNVDRILVGDIERTRLKEIRALFFLGVNDGNIPKMAGSGGILSDIDREFLEELHPEMELAPTPRKQMYIQKLYLYMNMTKPTERLFLSYARTGADKKTLRPSYLVSALQKLFPKLMVEQPEKLDWSLQLVNREDGVDLLAQALRSQAEGKENAALPVLLRLYGEESLYSILEGAAFYVYRDGKLARQTARLLYGELLQNSVSRLERFAACEYAHFLQYGLQLSERDEYEFETSDLGTIFHGILELFGRKLKENGVSWFDFTKEQAEKWVKEAIEEFAATYGETILYSSARRTYVLTRMERVMNRTVRTLQYQLRKGVFQPEHFEMSFTRVEDLSKADAGMSQKMKLVGRIDRVDTYEDEKHIYVKVLDYKSGSRQLDLAAVYYGLQLQLIVYLNAAVEAKRGENPEKEIIPAGVLYYRMADPLAEEDGESDEEVSRQITEKLRTVGLVNAEEAVLRLMDRDSEKKSDVIPVEWKKDGSLSAHSQAADRASLERISDYVNQKICAIGAGIMQGNMALNPYEMGSESSCAYCSYRNVCGFDRQIPGMGYRQLEELPADEVLERMAE